MAYDRDDVAWVRYQALCAERRLIRKQIKKSRGLETSKEVDQLKERAAILSERIEHIQSTSPLLMR